MKIIKENFAYIQKNDIIFMLTKEDSMPLSVYKSICTDKLSYVNHKNKYDFVKIEDENGIDFLRNITYILDFNDIKEYGIKEFKVFESNINREIENQIIKKEFASEKSNKNKIEVEIDKLHHKKKDLNLIK